MISRRSPGARSRPPERGTVDEIAAIDRLIQGFGRPSFQLNAPHEADAELLRLPGCDHLLAVTTDQIVEEIETGLYSDPGLIGWMTVMSSASDLAAVGARPLGILLAQTLPPGMDRTDVRAMQAGIAEACEATGLQVVGGDTNRSRTLQVGATAMGIVEGRPVTRVGCRPGDALFASGPLGLGSAYALDVLSRPAGATGTIPFRPEARLHEGQRLRPFASACMDTSDGALAALDELMRLNGTGFSIDAALSDMLHPLAITAVRQAGLPPWMLLAGPHGEFELLFTIPREQVTRFFYAVHTRLWDPIRLGEVTSRPGLHLRIDGAPRAIDTTAVRNLYDQVGGDVAAYAAGLERLGRSLATEEVPCPA